MKPDIFNLTLVLYSLLHLPSFGCSCQEEQFCDPNNQVTFLPVGSGIVGSWYREGKADESEPSFSFNDKGHFLHWRFGCGRDLRPLSPNETNKTPTNMGFQCRTLVKHVIEPGYFRLEYQENADLRWIDGHLLADGKLLLNSNIVSYYRGVFEQKPERLPSKRSTRH